MHFLSTVASALLLAGTALAQTGSTVTVHVVTVSTGDGKTLKYSPNSITANPGEMVQFQFMGGVSLQVSKKCANIYSFNRITRSLNQLSEPHAPPLVLQCQMLLASSLVSRR